MDIYFSGLAPRKDKTHSLQQVARHFFSQHNHRVFEPNFRQHRVHEIRTLMRQTKAFFLDVSFPANVYVGTQFMLALNKQKPIVALYQRDAEPNFLLSHEDERIFWTEYEPHNLCQKLQLGLQFVKEEFSVRYNCALTAQQYRYLHQQSKEKTVPKSTYIRQLIDDDMKRTTLNAERGKLSKK